MLLCTISYRGESCDIAAEAYAELARRNYVVQVHLRAGGVFDADVVDTMIGGDGQWRIQLRRWKDDKPSDTYVSLDIYDDIERIEVY